MRREDCVGGVGGAIPRPPDAEPLGPGCPPDASMRGLNFAIQMTAAVLVLGFFLARSYAKWAVSSPVRAEDWFCLTAFIMTLAYISCILTVHHYGDGYHAWDLAPETFKNYKLWLYASAVLYFPAAYLTKVTLLLLMARVFAVKEQIARGIYLFIVLITVLYTPVQIVKTILCVPIPAFWDGGVEPDFCFDSRKVFITDIALALCTDAVILILPVFLACPLHLGTWKKVKIALLPGAGGGAIGTDALRISKAVELQYETDTSGHLTLLTMLTTLELTTGFVCACMPPINLLLERYIYRTGFLGNTPRTPVQPWRLGAPIAAAPFPPADRARAAPTPPKRLSNLWSSLLTTTRATATIATVAGGGGGAPTSTEPMSTAASESGTSCTRAPPGQGGTDDAFTIDIERALPPPPGWPPGKIEMEHALITGRPLTRAAATAGGGGGGDDDRTTRGGPRDWIRRMVSSSQPRATAAERSTDAGTGNHAFSSSCTEPAASRRQQQQQKPEAATSSSGGAACELGGITKTVEISLERSALSSLSAPQEPSPLDAVMSTQAASDGRSRRLLSGVIRDGKTGGDEEKGDASL
ncbi:hypothetical protein RB594_006903 [Gaeumannomyces avenae]